MQTETIKYLYTPIRRTETQNTDNTNCRQEHDVTEIQSFGTGNTALPTKLQNDSIPTPPSFC